MGVYPRPSSLRLPERLTRHPLPGREEKIGEETRPSLAQVEICDMRQELREGNRHIFSRALSAGLRECLDSGNQAILFLNRRGSSSIIQCRDCGYVAVCRRCDTPLTYHAAPTRLLCHQCNYSRRPLTQCPECRGSRIRQLGLGTERVVAEVSWAVSLASAWTGWTPMPCDRLRADGEGPEQPGKRWRGWRRVRRRCW